MWKGVTVTTKPTVLPISVADIKVRLAVTFNDHDEMITALIWSAVARLDGPAGVGIALTEQVWRKTFEAFPAIMFLPGWPVKSVDAVKYRDADGQEQTFSSANYVVDLTTEPARVSLKNGSSWPAVDADIAPVWVEYTLGEASAANVPADLVSAVAIMVARMYENREDAPDVQPYVAAVATEYSRLRVGA